MDRWCSVGVASGQGPGRYNAAMLHEIVVPEAASDQRLDVFLETRLAGCSRSLVARCIKAGRCAIEPGKAKPGYRLRGGERLAIEVPELTPLEAVPEEIPLTVLYEDEDLLVVDKPAGMVVHPAVGHPRGTLLNAVLGRYGPASQPGLIHRLDADTSGVIAVARHPVALSAAQTAFKERRVQKAYLALLHGAPSADLLHCEAWLGRHRKDFRKRAVLPPESPGARSASTRVLVRERHAGYAVCEARPHTGRTHQIRVHCAHLGHPILADATYGRSARWPLAPTAGPSIQRQALHAWRLQLPHPRSGVDLVVESPIPADLLAFVSEDLQPLVA